MKFKVVFDCSEEETRWNQSTLWVHQGLRAAVMVLMFGLTMNGQKAHQSRVIVLWRPCVMTALTRARAQVKFFLFSALSITFLDILHVFPVC